MPGLRVMLVVGARPQFIKCAPVIREILSNHSQIDLDIVHTGQHYDSRMSEIFFSELEIPLPLANLKVGSGSHAAQTAVMMRRLEPLMLRTKPDIVAVPGDTNTTLAASLTASKICLPVAHIEAGLRSHDMAMPEEINRRLTDHCSRLLFAPTRTAVVNLRKEGLARATRLTGDTMVDAISQAMPIVQQEETIVLERLALEPENYVLVTLHRPSNVDNLSRLSRIHNSLCKVARKTRVIFLVHPRTRVRLAEIRAIGATGNDEVLFASPQGYIETLCLLKNASCLLTDSGGMQKESFLLHVPCVTLRSTTEWPETLERKANRLIFEPEIAHRALLQASSDHTLRERIKSLKSPFGDGHASERIARMLEESF